MWTRVSAVQLVGTTGRLNCRPSAFLLTKCDQKIGLQFAHSRANPAGACRNITQTAYATFKAWFDTTGIANREWVKITEDTEPFPGAPQHYWGLMSDGDEFPYCSTNYADAFFVVDAGPASGGGGQARGGGSCCPSGSGCCCDAGPLLPCRAPRDAVPLRGPSRSRGLHWTAAGLRSKDAAC